MDANFTHLVYNIFETILYSIIDLSENHLKAELECGCKINDVSGEIDQECLSHREDNFIHYFFSFFFSITLLI